MVSVWCDETELELVAEDISLMFAIVFDEEGEWNQDMFGKNGNEGIQSTL